MTPLHSHTQHPSPLRLAEVVISRQETKNKKKPWKTMALKLCSLRQSRYSAIVLLKLGSTVPLIPLTLLAEVFF